MSALLKASRNVYELTWKIMMDEKNAHGLLG
jgi:hypothetical protein